MTLGVFVVWPLARRLVPLFRALGNRLSLPVPSMLPSAIIMVYALTFHVVQRGFKIDFSHFLGEVAETLQALVALLFAIEAWRAHKGAPIPIFVDDE